MTTCPGPDVNDQVVRSRFQNELKQAMIGKGPQSYPGRSWTKAAHGPSLIALLCVVHSLFADTYQRFVTMLKKPVAAPPHVVGPPAVAEPAGPVVALADPAGHGAPLLDVAPAAADVEDDGDGPAATFADGGTGVGA